MNNRNYDGFKFKYKKDHIIKIIVIYLYLDILDKNNNNNIDDDDDTTIIIMI